MKKFLVGLFVFLLAVGCSAHQIGVELGKNVNDGYTLSLPVEFDVRTQLPFLPGAFLRTDCIFTAPRGDIAQLQHLNHEYFDMVIGGGCTIMGWRVEYETGGRNWWGGNSAGIPRGIVWNNAVRANLDF